MGTGSTTGNVGIFVYLHISFSHKIAPAAIQHSVSMKEDGAAETTALAAVPGGRKS